jgi:hypothetical protein
MFGIVRVVLELIIRRQYRVPLTILFCSLAECFAYPNASLRKKDHFQKGATRLRGTGSSTCKDHDFLNLFKVRWAMERMSCRECCRR